MASKPTRLQRARRRYLQNPTRPLLRSYLIVKARRGHFDPRMCTLHGVSPDVNVGCRRYIARGYAALLVPTSTLRFPVGAGSWHNARTDKGEGQAADLGVVPSLVGTRTHVRRLAKFQRAEFAAWKRGERPRMLELIGPDNDAVVLRSHDSELVEGTPLERQHDNHDHAAFR